jgi:hypothetical protein
MCDLAAGRPYIVIAKKHQSREFATHAVGVSAISQPFGYTVSLIYPASDENPARHGDCSIHDQAGGDRLRRYSISIKEERIMNKATSALIAAVATLALSGGAYAQAAGGGTSSGGSNGSTASPANQTNDSYGTPGSARSDSGMSAGARSSGLPSSTNNNSTSGTSAPKSNNTLATPSTVSPAAGQ